MLSKFIRKFVFLLINWKKSIFVFFLKKRTSREFDIYIINIAKQQKIFIAKINDSKL